jgi:hypothetical protein
VNLKKTPRPRSIGGIMLVLRLFGLVFPSVFFCRSLRPFVTMALGGVALLVLLSLNVARASNVDCSVPPYGDTWAVYHSYVENFGAYVDPAKLLPAICEGKFNTGDRTTYYKLGISPRDFATKSVTDLAIETLATMRKLARQVPPSMPQPDIAPGGALCAIYVLAIRERVRPSDRTGLRVLHCERVRPICGHARRSSWRDLRRMPLGIRSSFLAAA